MAGYANSFMTYQNSRFNYKMDYPSSLIPQKESENHDGRVFKNKNSKLIVWGAYSPENIKDTFNNALNDLKHFKIKYVVKKKNYFVISGENATHIAYFKTTHVCNENINMQIFYLKKDKTQWNSIIEQMNRSLKYVGTPCKNS